MVTLGLRLLREIKTERSLTQEQIADAINVHQSTVSLWLNGRNRPTSMEHRYALERVYGIPVTAWMSARERDLAFGRKRVREAG